MGIKTLIMILASLSFSVTALADDHEMGGEKKPFSIYGDFAGSLSFYDNEANGGTSGATNHDDFNIDLIELNLEKNWSKSSLNISIGYGSTAATVNALGTASINTLNVMNAFYAMKTNYGLGFMFGKFESPVGHETYNHMDNSQFTRSYGFTLAPYFSTGAMVDYGQDMWKAGFVVSNGEGMDTDGDDKNKTMGLIVDVDPMENLHIDLNYVTGTENVAGLGNFQSNLMEVSIAYMINEMIDVAVDYTDLGAKVAGGGDEGKATSIAGYVNANFGMFGLGLRYEQFTHDWGMINYNQSGTIAFPNVAGIDGDDNSISAITLAAKAEIDQNAIVMLEYRQDSSDDEVFFDKDGAPTDSASTITLGMMYRF